MCASTPQVRFTSAAGRPTPLPRTPRGAAGAGSRRPTSGDGPLYGVAQVDRTAVTRTRGVCSTALLQSRTSCASPTSASRSTGQIAAHVASALPISALDHSRLVPTGPRRAGSTHDLRAPRTSSPPCAPRPTTWPSAAASATSRRRSGRSSPRRWPRSPGWTRAASRSPTTGASRPATPRARAIGKLDAPRASSTRAPASPRSRTRPRTGIVIAQDLAGDDADRGGRGSPRRRSRPATGR